MRTKPAATNRQEDRRLVTGQGRFAADWNLPGQLHAAFLRSPHAHADFRAIDRNAALALPGVIAVLTGEDIAAARFRSLPSSLPFTGIGGQSLRKPPRPALALDRVRFVGEPVACVIATSAAIAQDGADALAVEYHERKAAVSVRDARAPDAPLLHDAVPGNVCFEFEIGDGNATERAFQQASRAVRLAVRHQRLVANPMEPRACLVQVDRTNGNCTIHTSTQGVNALRAQLAEATGIAEERIRVLAQDVGGGFGVRYNAYPEHCVLMLAARQVAAPVKWVASRTESFLSDEQGRGVESEGEVALDPSGRILALRFHFVCDMGAYLTATGPFIDIANVMETLSGVYRVPALYARFDLVMTNTTPVGAYRGAGRPLAAYLIERLVDQAAVESGIDRIELRRRNFVPKDGFPYRTPHAGIIDCGDFAGVLDRALQAADWSGFPARRETASREGRLRGIGLACYIEFSSPGFYPKDEVEIRFADDGMIHLHAVTQSSGQSHETTFAMIVGDVLGLPIERMRLHTGDVQLGLIGSATGGSRSLFGVGSVFRLAAQEVVRKARALAARAFGVSESQLLFADGVFSVRGDDRSVTLAALAANESHATPHPLDVRVAAKFGGNYPNGCHVAEVEIDPQTGATTVLRYTAVDDCGTVISPVVVEGQVVGGVVQGLGQALLEHALFDAESGQMQTASFMDYALPRAGVIREFEVIEHPVPTAANPLGAKGVGEAGATGAPPAIMNAVLDALRSAGITSLDSPASAVRVWTALRAKRAAGSVAASTNTT